MSRRKAHERFAALRASWWRHRDVMPLSRAAAGVYALALSYCADDLTDGHVSRHMAVKTLAGGKVGLCKELVDAALWAETETGYVIDGYLDHNPSKAQLEEMANQKREAGSRGGRRKAERVAGATPLAKHVLEQVRSKSLQDIDIDIEPLRGSARVSADEDEPKTLRQRVRDTLALQATPGTAHRLAEMLSDLHSDHDTGRPYLQPGMCSAADRVLWAKIIAAAEPIATEHCVTVMSVIAGEWVALVSLAAADELPRVGNVIAYFAKRFGSLKACVDESDVSSIPPRREAA